ncbi:hypothetical protein GP486_000171 [Trichoglossum hirsutum]|uniref:Uncharacterized protein n=1 Tax=Trichoglossum hirsutum TaxID=265104 RepID=A0A9P8LJE8_9PEZI|nr:hypothetical protein GP486_000171 [Trichoglossum hirsutum]
MESHISKLSGSLYRSSSQRPSPPRKSSKRRIPNTKKTAVNELSSVSTSTISHYVGNSDEVADHRFHELCEEIQLRLMKDILHATSPAAWELRETDEQVEEYTAAKYFKDHNRDLLTIASLRSHIRQFRAFSGHNIYISPSKELDDAFWRVWTFCKLFGCGKSSEGDISDQVDWLRGGRLAQERARYCSSQIGTEPCVVFGKGNRGGLSIRELHFMKAVWQCLGGLLKGFRSRCELARKYAIFEYVDVDEDETLSLSNLLDEWIFYLTSLGLHVILDLAAPSAQDSPTGFKIADENGWTRWRRRRGGRSWSRFLLEAVDLAIEFTESET